MTSVPRMACSNWFLYTKQRIDLRMSFYVKHNRCEHCKKGPVEYVFLPFLSILIYSNAYKLH